MLVLPLEKEVVAKQVRSGRRQQPIAPHLNSPKPYLFVCCKTQTHVLTNNHFNAQARLRAPELNHGDATRSDGRDGAGSTTTERQGAPGRNPAHPAPRRRAPAPPRRRPPAARPPWQRRRSLTGTTSGTWRVRYRRTSWAHGGGGLPPAACGRTPAGCPSPPSWSPRPRLRREVECDGVVRGWCVSVGDKV